MDNEEIVLNSPEDLAMVHAIACYADDWLRENDLDYGTSSGDWQEIDGARCEPPSSEVPYGDNDDLAFVAERRKTQREQVVGRWVRDSIRKRCECGTMFPPYTQRHEYCSERCQTRYYMRRRRADNL